MLFSRYFISRIVGPENPGNAEDQLAMDVAFHPGE